MSIASIHRRIPLAAPAAATALVWTTGTAITTTTTIRTTTIGWSGRMRVSD